VLLGTTVAGEALTVQQTAGVCLVLTGILLGHPAAKSLAAQATAYARQRRSTLDSR
jgi:hypothetical protein